MGHASNDTKPGLKKFVLAISWAILIGIVSLLPKSVLTHTKRLPFEHTDKMAHMVMYGILTVLMLRAYSGLSKIGVSKMTRIGVELGAYGLLLELLQKYTYAGRTFEISDIFANIGGVLVGMIIFKYLKPFRL